MKDKKGNWVTTLIMIIPYLIIIGIAQTIAFYLLGIDITGGIPKTTTFQHFVLLLFTTAGSFLSIWCFTKYIENQKFNKIGLNVGRFFTKDILLGLFTTLVLFFTSFSTLSLFGQTSWHINKEIEIDQLLLSMATFVLVATTEELFTRGYLLGNLLISLNKWGALAISSIIFAAFHLANPNMSWLSFVNLFLAGILLGLPYLFTKNLWFSIAFHFGWNFFQGTVFGFNVSGRDGFSLILQSRVQNNAFNGGEFGFEGSIWCVIAQLICIYIIYLIFKNRRVVEGDSPINQGQSLI
ncbi:lysostaphin resistance A-like protein [Pedobacter sp.]